MLWNTLIKKVQKYVDECPDDAGSQTIRALSRITGKSIQAYLESFEACEVDHIRKIAPNSFPRKLRESPLIVEKNIHDAWRVYAMKGAVHG